MNYEAAAEKLIQVIKGELTDENIKGVMSVLATVVEVNDSLWEQWLTMNTNKLLARDSMRCSCGQLIQIERERRIVYTQLV